MENRNGNNTFGRTRVEELVGGDLAARFAEICGRNGAAPERVLSSFIKDYIVSGGHPEQVANGWPWSRQD